MTRAEYNVLHEGLFQLIEEAMTAARICQDIFMVEIRGTPGVGTHNMWVEFRDQLRIMRNNADSIESAAGAVTHD